MAGALTPTAVLNRTQHLSDDLTPSRPGNGGEMLRLEAVTKKYGPFTAVNGVDLMVPRGRIFGFLGPNGAGKTTTIRMIAGVLLPSSGRVVIGDDDLASEVRSSTTLHKQRTPDTALERMT